MNKNISKLLLVAAALVVGGLWMSVHASGNDEFEKSYNFTAVTDGQGNVNLHLLAFSEGAGHNHWAGRNTSSHDNDTSTIYYEYSGISPITGHMATISVPLMKYYSTNDDNTSEHGYVVFRLLSGTIQYTNQQGQTLIQTNDKAWHTVYVNRDDTERKRTFFDFTWYPIPALSGMDYRLKAHILDEKTTGSDVYEYVMGTFTGLVLQQPEMMTPFFAGLPESKGMIGVPYLAYNSVARMEVYNADGRHYGDFDMPAQSDILYLAGEDTVQRGVYANMLLKRDSAGGMSWKNSTSVDIPAYHKIYDFAGEEYRRNDGMPTGYNRLTWTIRHYMEEDIMVGDVFEIQRATLSNYQDAEVVGIINMMDTVSMDSQGNAHYEFVDSMMLEHRAAHWYYRIRRSSAAVWDWSAGGYADSVQIVNTTRLVYIRPGGPRVVEDEHFGENRKVWVEVPLVEESGTTHTGIWDERLTLTLHRYQQGLRTEDVRLTIPGDSIHLKKQNGEVYWEARWADELLSPCMHYSYTVEVDTAQCRYLYDEQKYQSVAVSMTSDYYYDQSAGIGSFHASQGYYDHVLLAWTKTEGDVDTYDLERKNSNGQYEPVVTGLVDNYYRDYGVAGEVMNEYRLVSHYECEGMMHHDTAYCKGWAGMYGSISGMITYADGTADKGARVVMTGLSDDEKVWRSIHTPDNTLESRDEFHCPNGMTLQYYIKSTENTPALQIGEQVITGEDTQGGWVLKTVQLGSAQGKLIIPASSHYIALLRIWDHTMDALEVSETDSIMAHGKEAGLVAYYLGNEPNGEKNFYNYAYRSGTDTVRNDLIASGQSETHSEDAPSGGLVKRYAYTDMKGSYTLGLIPVDSARVCEVSVSSMKGEYHYGNTSSNMAAIGLEPGLMEKKGIDFVNVAAVRLSGRVLYEGTSVPVRDARFRVNGEVVRDSRGNELKTDVNGSFMFYVPKNGCTIQVEKQHHTFLNDGYVLLYGDTLVSLQENLDGVRLWDKTRVRVVGRIAGGMEQTHKPLGYGLSQNNLGDSVRIVLALEGDNTSYMVFDKEDLAYVERWDTVRHPIDGQQTTIYTQQKRLTICPDPVTGEFMVDLLPVKYKVLQATAEGYVSLLPGGMPFVYDLSNKVTPLTLGYDTMEMKCNDTLKITYRSPITLTYKQLLYGMELDYYGEASYSSKSLDGKAYTLPMIHREGDSIRYTFGYPLFLETSTYGRPYTFRAYVHEDYYYNNNPRSIRHEQVPIRKGTLNIYNSLAKESHHTTAALRDDGTADFQVDALNTTFELTGENALRELVLSCEVDGEYVQGDILRAFVTGYRDKGRNTTIQGKPVVVDVLRDPPGAGSYSYIEQGTTYKFDYNWSIDFEVGTEIYISGGANYMLTTGAVGPGVYSGTVTSGAKEAKLLDLPLTLGGVFKKVHTYEMTTSERITTSSSMYDVGADADLYIGVGTSYQTAQREAFMAINAATQRMLMPAIHAGLVKQVAMGVEDGDTCYLVVADELAVSAGMASQFVYSQRHILNVLIPELFAERDALLIYGSKAQVEMIADAQHKVLYATSLAPDEEGYGITGYEPCYPTGWSGLEFDKIQAINQQIAGWVDIIGQNEREKMSCTQAPYEVYSIDALSSVTHSESMNYYNSYSGNLTYPSAVSVVNTKLVAATLKKGGYFGDNRFNELRDLINLYNKDEATADQKKKAQQTYEATIKTPAMGWKLKFEPILNFDSKNDNYAAVTHKKSTGFTLSTTNDSYLSVAVYRMVKENEGFNEDSRETRQDAFSQYIDNFKYTDDSLLYAGFVFKTLGGATRCPYEDEETTLFYHTGSVLSNRTIQIDKPTLSITEREISNIPEDGVALVHVMIANESELTASNGGNAAYGQDSVTNSQMQLATPSSFTLKFDDASNAHGLSLFMDGAPLSDGRSITINPGDAPVNKTIEVHRGEVYDYEDVKLKLLTSCKDQSVSATFSVHFMPSASPIHISVPGDKWVMNTLSPHDSIGYYLPITIDGFDMNYLNFDHIELQYKRHTESDEAWVNLCSFYADENYYNDASGNKQLLKEGIIRQYPFYGGRNPEEQEYDIRAVSFSRWGSGFVSRSSDIITGVKDTFLPILFGKPSPANGILGVEDVLSLTFNEDINGGILDEDVNFEIIGYTNSTDFCSTTSLHYGGESSSYAESKAKVNLSNTSFSIDMMICPDSMRGGRVIETSPMTLFAHGNGVNNQVIFQLNPTGCLEGNINGVVFHSQPITWAGWTRVVMVFDNSTGKVRFYAGTQDITDPQDEAKTSAYSGTTQVVWGSHYNHTNPYRGRMLEARLWTTALNQSEISLTHYQHLTGQERELINYYPMNTGLGTTVTDMANGNTLTLHGTDWVYPNGASMDMRNAKDGIRLETAVFNRSELQDYTLSLWFNSPTVEDTAVIFSAGSMEIDMIKGQIVVRDQGGSMATSSRYDDGRWYQMALSVSRVENIACLWVNAELVMQFQADILGGMASAHTQLGLSAAGKYPFKGYLANLALWEKATPAQMIQFYYQHAPYGTEMGLIAYLTFAEQKESESGILELIYSPYNHKIVKDINGVVSKRKENLVVNDVETLFTRDKYPIYGDGIQLTKIPFNWATRDNELFITLKSLDKEINHRQLFMTVRGVEDEHGNPMANPVTWTVYVNREQIRWRQDKVAVERVFGEDETTQVRASFVNESGSTLSWRITGTPSWYQISLNQGTIGPLEEQEIVFTIDQQLDPGEYEDYIYVEDENGLGSNLHFTLNVIAQEPDWAVDHSLYNKTMSLIGTVELILDNEGDEMDGKFIYDTDSRDIVAAFVGSDCVGTAHVEVSSGGKSMTYMTIYGNSSIQGKSLTFRLWRASNGQVYRLKASPSVTYKTNTIVGDKEPIHFTTNVARWLYALTLEKGWNWISTGVQFSNTTPNDLFLSHDLFRSGDQMKSLQEYFFADYSTQVDNGSWVVGVGSDVLNYTYSYMLYMHEAGTVYTQGNRITDEQRGRKLHQGWNSLAYLCDYTQAVKDAMVDYIVNATEGDLLKSYSEFAVWTDAGGWQGSLKYMHPGEGYMLKRLGAGDVDFHYLNNKPINETPAAAPMRNRMYEQNMPLILTIEGIDIEDGDMLMVGETPYLLDGEEVHYMMAYGTEGTSLSFQLVRNGQVIARAKEHPQFDSQTIWGSMDKPAVVHFSETEEVENTPSGVEKRVVNQRVYIIRDNQWYDILGERQQ